MYLFSEHCCFHTNLFGYVKVKVRPGWPGLLQLARSAAQPPLPQRCTLLGCVWSSHHQRWPSAWRPPPAALLSPHAPHASHAPPTTPPQVIPFADLLEVRKRKNVGFPNSIELLWQAAGRPAPKREFFTSFLARGDAYRCAQRALVWRGGGGGQLG